MATLAPSAARPRRGRQADAIGGASDQDLLAVESCLSMGGQPSMRRR